jgi:hypothetical protein
MPAISTCPKCQRQVSIPAGVEAAAAVRCPLCEAEYPLGESLALAPPELIPVVAVAKQESAAEAAEEKELHETPAETDEAAAVAHEMPIEIGSALRRRRTSWLGKAVGLVVFGLAGCVAALYLLAFFLGPQYRANGFPERVHIEGVCDFPLPWMRRLTTPAEKPNEKPNKAKEMPKL